MLMAVLLQGQKPGWSEYKNGTDNGEDNYILPAAGQKENSIGFKQSHQKSDSNRSFEPSHIFFGLLILRLR